MKSLAAHFLVSSPQLVDPNFLHTVVLLIQHTDEGALGVVLNRPTSKTVEELWKEVGKSPCLVEGPVHLGGPVPGPIMSVHANQFFAELEILPGVFFAAKKDNLDELVMQQDDPMRIFLGHAGWGPGQLAGELRRRSWDVVPADLFTLFRTDPQWMWETLTEGRRVALFHQLGLGELGEPREPESPARRQAALR